MRRAILCRIFSETRGTVLARQQPQLWCLLRTTSRGFAEYVMKVPHMGDSITEGTISSWQKQVGDNVAADEVVVTIDTDKVSVEVRAEVGGSVTELYAGVDETVQVGQSLLRLDTEKLADARLETSTPELPASTSAPAAPASSPAQGTTKRAHVPLIKFLGKRSLLKREHQPVQKIATATSPPAQSTSPSAQPRPTLAPPLPDALGVLALGAFYGRPPVTEEEIEAVQSGGASLFP